MTYKEKLNISTLFLLPLYLNKKVNLNELINDKHLQLDRETIEFVNCYNLDINRPNFRKNSLHLIFDHKVNHSYFRYFGKLSKLDNFICDVYYEIEEKPYLCISLSKPEGIHDTDIENIITGNYELISDLALAKICSFWFQYTEILSRILTIVRKNKDHNPIDEVVGENTYRFSFKNVGTSLDDLDIALLF